MDFIKIKTLALKKDTIRTTERQATNREKMHARHMADKQLTSEYETTLHVQ